MEKIIISTERQVMLDGLMTLGLLENGLRIADFQCCEDVLLDAFSGTFKVEGKPEKLVRQASAIAQKVLREIILKQQAV